MADNNPLQTLFQNFQKVTNCVQTHLSNVIHHYSSPQQPPIKEQPPLLSVPPSIKSSPDLTHQILLKPNTTAETIESFIFFSVNFLSVNEEMEEEFEDFNSVMDFWTEFDLETKKCFLQGKMDLLEKNKNKSEDELEKIKAITGDFQTFPNESSFLDSISKHIISLRNRAETAENAFSDFYDMLRDAPDPRLALIAMQKKLQAASSFSRYRSEYDDEKGIAGGGYGKVVSCRNKLDSQYYAVKKILFNADERDKVLREVHALSRLKHKNIVQYYQAWVEPYEGDSDDSSSDSERLYKESCLYIQMELCVRTLVDVLEKKIDQRIAWKYFQQIVDGVCNMHQQNIIHRDLSSKNILLDDSDNIKISDFGLVKIQNGGVLLCTSGDKLGTEFYRAPEAEHENSIIDSKVDIYSLGILLVELLGCFSTGMERIEILSNVRKHKKLPLRWPYDHEDLIHRLLSNEPCDRPSAAQLLQQQPWAECLQEGATLGSEMEVRSQ